jgi:hypothetical protein
MQGVQLDALSINLDQQSTLARLLARENITVIHGAYKTAWFDPTKRVLALPIWKNKGKAVYDLLTGHEVGHALYTPAKGWHDAVDDIAGAPKAYLNVLEDVRIERKVQDLYPGLRFQFRKAYKQLAEDDFFGIEKNGVDVNFLKVIDKINVKAKLGDHIDVDMDPIEQGYFDRAYMCETFDDVIWLAKEIYDYQKSLEKSMPITEELPTISISSQGLDDIEESNEDDYEKPEPTSEEQPETEESPVEEKEEPATEEEQPETGKTGRGTRDEVEQKELHKDDVKTESDKDKHETKDIDEEEIFDQESLTDKAFRDREQELVASDELNRHMIYTINKVRQPEIVIDYKEYYAEWKKHLSDVTKLDTWYAQRINEQLVEMDDTFKKFKSDTDLAAAYMAKEFELRKAAYQYSRSTLQKTGVINTNRLHAYKISEDIFLKSTKLANYKNHGMMLFIDFSGSMSESIGPTIRQMLNLAAFCRMINVPYEVYAFTTRVRSEEEDTTDYNAYSDSEIIMQKFNLLNLMSSRMSRREYAESFRMLWNLSMAWDNKMHSSYINAWNHLHSTPLNTCIVYAHDMIAAYKSKNNIEKMTTMFLTDGESDSFQVRMTEEAKEHRLFDDGVYGYRGRKAIIRCAGRSFTTNSVTGSEMTKNLLKSLKKSTNSNVLGFFISEYRNQSIAKAVDEAPPGQWGKYKEKYTEQMNKNRCLIEDNIFGYDRYFGLCQKYMDIVEDEFGEMVEDGASKNKIKTAFAKMTKSKRVNRILLNAFVDAIA